MEKLFTTTEVGAYLKVSDYTVRRYIKQGRIKSIKMGTKHRITEDALNEFLDLAKGADPESLEIKELD